MGAWGAAVFSDDTASDIRGEYRELLEDQVADDEATRRIINSYRHLDRDEAHVLWLASRPPSSSSDAWTKTSRLVPSRSSTAVAA
jgi:hypothetical protein